MPDDLQPSADADGVDESTTPGVGEPHVARARRAQGPARGLRHPRVGLRGPPPLRRAEDPRPAARGGCRGPAPSVARYPPVASWCARRPAGRPRHPCGGEQPGRRAPGAARGRTRGRGLGTQRPSLRPCQRNPGPRRPADRPSPRRRRTSPTSRRTPRWRPTDAGAPAGAPLSNGTGAHGRSDIWVPPTWTSARAAPPAEPAVAAARLTTPAVGDSACRRRRGGRYDGGARTGRSRRAG